MFDDIVFESAGFGDRLRAEPLGLAQPLQNLQAFL
jgi:hypothetical protein